MQNLVQNEESRTRVKTKFVLRPSQTERPVSNLFQDKFAREKSEINQKISQKMLTALEDKKR